jgi:cysteinyl-tRNA synthetase
MRIYNSLTNNLDEFQALDTAGRKVSFYTCGPTVYDYAHIGNFRSFLNADVMRRTLELLGFEVNQVMNMTDVGHMSDDDLADGGGEDKMAVAQKRLAQAKKSGKLPEGVQIDPSDPHAIADFYADAFVRDAKRLGLKVVHEAENKPEIMPRPTRYIKEMIALIETLVAKEHAYVGDDGVVYFSTQSFPAYGNLSGNTLDKIRSGEGGRVAQETQNLKKHPADFMLWKPDSKHLMRWPSPWGEGYPGWHLECSVMAQCLLAQDSQGVIDLHSGGEDNIFPHHECEIAQSCAGSGQTHFARYWFHTRFLNVEGEKMSKSKGNFFTLEDMLKKGVSPAALRLELIRMHYRSHANFTFQGLKDCQRQVNRWGRLEQWLRQHSTHPQQSPGPLALGLDKFKEALRSDLNISGAIAALNEAASHYDVSRSPRGTDGEGCLADELRSLLAMNEVLGVLDIEQDAPGLEAGLDVERIQTLIDERLKARADKDWARADQIRDELLTMKIQLKDGSDGTTWSKILSAS